MRRADFHHLFYLLGTVTLAAAMPLSHFVMGLATFLLLLNWIAEWNWPEKWKRTRENRQGLWFSAFYIIYAIGLIHVTDWAAAGKEMLAMLPFLLSPIIVISSKPFSQKELQVIFSAFILATLFGCCWNFGYAQTHPIDDLRQMSRFIDHIRFSLCVVMSVVFCLHYAFHHQERTGWLKYIYLIITILLIPYLLYAQTLSGIIILMVLAICYLVHLILIQKSGRFKWALGGVTLILLTSSIVYVFYVTYDYGHVKDTAPDTTALTASGNPYTFDENSIVENGYHIGYYVCEEELPGAWARRSGTAYDELTAATLVRYLNSLGMRKDSAAVMALSDEDIRNIERRQANVYYTHNTSLRRTLYETYFGFSLYRHYGIINESSLLERVELWRATWSLIRENWLFGVGVGQERAALDRQLALQHSPIADKKHGRGSHNQFLTYWLAAGIIPVVYFVFLLAYPFFGMRKRVTFVYFALIALLFLSMLVEDTLNAQTGRMLFTIFVPLLLFRSPEETPGA